MAIDNDSTAAGARALDLRVEPDRTPMRVNSDTRVTNLNADLVDGMNASTLLEPRGYAHIKIGGSVDTDYPSKGVVGVLIPEGKTSVYCFDLTFTPTAAVGSPHFNNSAVVAAATPNLVSSFNDVVRNNCPTTHRDAAVKTHPEEVNFQVVFF